MLIGQTRLAWCSIPSCLKFTNASMAIPCRRGCGRRVIHAFVSPMRCVLWPTDQNCWHSERHPVGWAWVWWICALHKDGWIWSRKWSDLFVNWRNLNIQWSREISFSQDRVRLVFQIIQILIFLQSMAWIHVSDMSHRVIPVWPQSSWSSILSPLVVGAEIDLFLGKSTFQCSGF